MSHQVTKGFTLAAIVLMTSGCIVNIPASHAESLNHQQQTLTLDSAELNQLVAETGAGQLNITGADVSNITVVADIYSNDDADIDLSLAAKGDKAELIAKIDNGLFSSSNSPYIDVTVTVPAAMLLDIEDGSGSIEIEKMTNDIAIVDGSGSIDIHGGKQINIKDGSGSITLEQTMGSVSIDDGSGGIEVGHVQGNVEIDDGSGGILVEHVKGAVSIADGSGNIDVEHIAGLVTINDGSGSIDVNHTQGLVIKEAGSGSVDFDDINGPVSMD